MATSNGLFLGVRQPTLQDTGWEVWVSDRYVTDRGIAVVPEFLQLTLTMALNDPGAGSITINLDTPFWSQHLTGGLPTTYLLDDEHLWSAYEDGVLRMQWLGTNVQETIVGEMRTAVVSGPGIGQILTWAKVLPPGFPNPPPALVWPFTVTTPNMTIFRYLFDAAKTRKAIWWIVPLFTATKDSAGRPWDDVTHPFTIAAPFVPELGSDLLTQLNIATGQDTTQYTGLRAEWMMWPNFRLDVRPRIGVDRSRSVIFFEGAVQTVDRTRNRASIANYIIVRDDVGNIRIASGRPSALRWHRREDFQVRSNIVDGARKSAIAAVGLQQLQYERVSWTIVVPYDLPGHRAFTDYHVGDSIGFSRFVPGVTSTVESFRIMAMTVQVTTGQLPTVELTLQTTLDAYEILMARKLTSLLNIINSFPDPLTIGRVYVQVTEPMAAKTGDFWVVPPGMYAVTMRVKMPDGTWAVLVA